MDPKRIRARLLALRSELASRHSRIEKHLDQREEPLPHHREDLASELSNRDTLEELDAGAVVELHDIDHALARLDTGQYGVCERCRRAIAPERLELLPFAATCATCAPGVGR